MTGSMGGHRAADTSAHEVDGPATGNVHTFSIAKI